MNDSGVNDLDAKIKDPNGENRVRIKIFFQSENGRCFLYSG